MTYRLLIHQKNGLFKHSLTFAQLQKQFGGSFRIGGIGPFFGFEPTPQKPDDNHEASYMLHGLNTALGRGFYLFVGKKFSSYELIIPLPTTKDDLQDMFSFAGTLAHYLEADTVEDSRGERISRAGLFVLYPHIAQHNAEVLKSYATVHDDFSVSGIKYPLKVPATLCKRMASAPPEHAERFFAAWLSETQAVDYVYMKPFLCYNEHKEPCAFYTLHEGDITIIPKKPFLPYGPNPFSVPFPSLCYVEIMSASIGLLGIITYDEFLSRLNEDELKEFDDEHYILRTVYLRRLQELAENALFPPPRAH